METIRPAHTSHRFDRVAAFISTVTVLMNSLLWNVETLTHHLYDIKNIRGGKVRRAVTPGFEGIGPSTSLKTTTKLMDFCTTLRLTNPCPHLVHQWFVLASLLNRVWHRSCERTRDHEIPPGTAITIDGRSVMDEQSWQGCLAKWILRDALSSREGLPRNVA